MQEAGCAWQQSRGTASSLWFWGDLVKASCLTRAAEALSEEHPMCWDFLLPDELGTEL